MIESRLRNAEQSAPSAQPKDNTNYLYTVILVATIKQDHFKNRSTDYYTFKVLARKLYSYWQDVLTFTVPYLLSHCHHAI